MEEALRAYLAADADVVARVSDRIYWGRRSQFASTLPALVLQRVSAPRDYHLTGPSGLVEARVQIDCFGASYGEAKLTARDVAGAINGYSGTVSGTVFQRISIENERDYDDTESDAGRHLFVTSLDLQIWHDE